MAAKGLERRSHFAQLEALLRARRELGMLGLTPQQLLLEGAALALALGQFEDVAQIGREQALLLAFASSASLAHVRLARLQLPRHPGASLRSCARRGHLLGIAQHRAQIGPDALSERLGRDRARPTAPTLAEAQAIRAAMAHVLPIPTWRGSGWATALWCSKMARGCVRWQASSAHKLLAISPILSTDT